MWILQLVKVGPIRAASRLDPAAPWEEDAEIRPILSKASAAAASDKYPRPATEGLIPCWIIDEGDPLQFGEPVVTFEMCTL